MGRTRNKEDIEQKRQELLKNVDKAKNDGNIEDAQMFDNPLFEPVIERDYSGVKNIEVQGIIPDSMPEPENDRITVDFNEAPSPNFDEYEGDTEPKQKAVFDEEMGGLDKKEQKILASNFSDTVVDGYKLLIQLCKDGFQKTKESYQAKAIQGKFNMGVMDMPVDVGAGSMIKFSDFISSYNEMITETMVLDPDKEKEMRELLKRISISRGIGMSDETRLTFMVIEDAGTKIFSLIAANKMIKNVETYIMKVYENQQEMMRGGNQNAKQNQTRPEKDSKPLTPVENAEVIKEKGEE